jgi:apurinic endonuclease APN1
MRANDWAVPPCRFSPPARASGSPTDVSDEQVQKLLAAEQETGIHCVVSHAAYLINLASPDPDTRRKSYEAYLAELRRCAKLGIRYAVVHMGSHPDFETGMQLLTENLRNLLAEMPDGVCIAMETMAGQGSALCYRFEHFARLLDALPDERLVICADTCHLFAAGYDLRTEKTYRAVWEEFDRLIGLSRLQVWHLNDSKKPSGVARRPPRAYRRGRVRRGRVPPAAERPRLRRAADAHRNARREAIRRGFGEAVGLYQTLRQGLDPSLQSSWRNLPYRFRLLPNLMSSSSPRFLFSTL